jgi:hypothetical protein
MSLNNDTGLPSEFITAYNNSGKLAGTYGKPRFGSWSLASGDFLYSGSTEITIIDYIGSGDAVIPTAINNITVTGIGDWAFSYCTSLTGITIPNSVIGIGDWAFFQCTSLTGITIPDSVTSIGNGAFFQCTSLISVTILDGVASIGGNAFGGCTSLAGITIPDSVESIGGYAFYGCSGLTSVTFADTIPSTNFNPDQEEAESGAPYFGILRAKFYETDADNGTPGTYTRASGSDTWVRE